MHCCYLGLFKRSPDTLIHHLTNLQLLLAVSHPSSSKMFRNLLNMFGQADVHPTIPQPQRIRFYQLLPQPTLDELRMAAYICNRHFARAVQYAFGGSFAALIRYGEVAACEIEMVVEHGGYEQTSQIMSEYPEYFGITQHNDHIVVIREDETFSYGVSVQRFELGTEGYPDSFIPPYNSDLRDPHVHQDLEPNFYQQSLGFLTDSYVPILQSRCLLYQRLWCFERRQFAPYGRSDEKHLKRDILDIRSFLHRAVADQNRPFPIGDRFAITQVVRSWILFAEDNFVVSTVQDVNAWIQLGVQLNIYDIAERFRGN